MMSVVINLLSFFISYAVGCQYFQSKHLRHIELHNESISLLNSVDNYRGRKLRGKTHQASQSKISRKNRTIKLGSKYNTNNLLEQSEEMRFLQMSKQIVALGDAEDLRMNFVSNAAAISKRLATSILQKNANFMNIAWAYSTFTHRKRILCALFTDFSKSSLNTFQLNMNESKNHRFDCDWAIIGYKGDPFILKQMKNIAREAGVHLAYADFALPLLEMVERHWPGHEDPSYNIREKVHLAKMYPKPLLYFSIRTVAKLYQYVWTLDNDVILNGTHVNFQKLYSDLQCGLYSHEPPLLSQLTSIDNGNLNPFYPYLHSNAWQNSTVNMVTSAFVEIQSPIFHTLFFEWFLDSIISPLIAPILITGADYGIDNVFCGAAKYYAEEVHRRLRYGHPAAAFNKAYTSISHCAIHTKQSFTHLNLKSSMSGLSAEELTQDRAYKHRLISAIHDIFPQFWTFGQLPKNDPRVNQNSFLAFLQTNSTCPEE